MSLDLLGRLVSWLKKILHICPRPKCEKYTLADIQAEIKPVELTQPSEIPSIKAARVQEKPAELLLLEGKATEIAPLDEKRVSIILSKEEPVVAIQSQEKQLQVSSETFEKGTMSDVLQEQSREKILTTQRSQGSDASLKEIKAEPQIKYPIEDAKTEETIIKKEDTDSPKQQKPYIKKPSTEGKLPRKLTTSEKRPFSPKQREPIDLGATQRRRRGSIKVQGKSQSDENFEKETNDKTLDEKEFAATVEAPFVEIDLDSANVYLVLPQQQFATNMLDKTPQQLCYNLEINGGQQKVLATITERHGYAVAKEKRILLKEPLVKFQVAFPMEMLGREYNCNHKSKDFYVFVAIGNNRGRMYYLYDEDGNIKPLPKRNIWILLDENSELLTEPDVIEEKWIWEGYKPFRVNLSKIDTLVIKNKVLEEEKSLFLQSTFHVEGDRLVEDDFKKEFPLFMDKALKVMAPCENPSGWNVWIQNKFAGFRAKENWTGSNPLTLSCPEDLPCDCGEFQVDICQPNTRIPDETLFFRWMPCIELDYPKELIIPNSKLGHTPSTISVRLDSNNEWELKHEEGQELKPRQHGFYQIELPPDDDTLRFSIAKTNVPKSTVNFQITVPRVKWKTSKQSIWGSKFQKVERNDLKPGELFCFLVKTNDFDNKYDLLAILGTNGHKLQEGKFIRKGIEYSLELNQFFDTVTHHKEDELTLRVEIRRIGDPRLLASVEAFYFEGKSKIQKKVLPAESRDETISKFPHIQAMVKCSSRVPTGRKGKGFSKKEVIDAGMDLKDVRRLNIPYDRRRKSSHQSNINTLRRRYENDGRR